MGWLRSLGFLDFAERLRCPGLVGPAFGLCAAQAREDSCRSHGIDFGGPSRGFAPRQALTVVVNARRRGIRRVQGHFHPRARGDSKVSVRRYRLSLTEL